MLKEIDEAITVLEEALQSKHLTDWSESRIRIALRTLYRMREETHNRNAGQAT